MAVGIHFVYVSPRSVDYAGNILRKDDPSVTINQQLRSELSHRVVPDVNVPNSANYPDVKTYLQAEALDNYVVYHMDQNTIVTYNQSDINGA